MDLIVIQSLGAVMYFAVVLGGLVSSSALISVGARTLSNRRRKK